MQSHPTPTPSFAHPLPERILGILATTKGLLILPRSSAPPSHSHHTSASSTSSTSSTSSSTPAPAAAPSQPLHLPPATATAPVRSTSLGLRLAAKSNLVAPTAPSRFATPPSSSPACPDAVRIGWQRDAAVERIPYHQWSSTLQKMHEEQGAEVHELAAYGLVGLERIFNRAYLFVITGRKEVGEFLHPSRKVYCCSGVIAIPLDEQEARRSIQAQIAKDKAADKGAQKAEASKLDDPAEEAETDDDNEDDDDDNNDEAEEIEDMMDDVETPAAIPREPFFSGLASTSSGGGAEKAAGNKPLSPSPLSSSSTKESGAPISSNNLKQADALKQEEKAGTSHTQSVDVPSSDPAAPPSTAEANPEAANLEAEAIEAAPATPDEQWRQAMRVELEEKVVKETSKHFARGEFWFAYDFDLTTSTQKKYDTLASVGSRHGGVRNGQANAAEGGGAIEGVALEEPLSNLPLWRRADRRFWHNEHLCGDLIEAQLDAFILPLMQGYLQIVSLPIELASPVTVAVTSNREGSGDGASAAATSDGADSEAGRVSSTLLVVSRRSKERAGLRYQRRGINETGQVANFVETEQILRLSLPVTKDQQAQPQQHVFSFLQIRGSIPLFWSQSPFSPKPPPVLERSAAENREACERHFATQTKRYGRVVCINLAEQEGKEGVISKAYKQTVEELELFQQGKVGYRDFDFHKECAGMKYENVENLIKDLKETMVEFSFFHAAFSSSPTESDLVGGWRVETRQKGTFRTSCLDCLDRTNVVQSALARNMLQAWLDGVGVGAGGV
ncbi:hypothetical protein ACQY0O_008290 [Thecaphora frezii]